MALTVKGMRAHPDWLRQWRGGERSPYPAATPHDIAWHFGREIDRQNPGETIEDYSIDTGLLPVADDLVRRVPQAKPEGSLLRTLDCRPDSFNGTEQPLSRAGENQNSAYSFDVANAPIVNDRRARRKAILSREPAQFQIDDRVVNRSWLPGENRFVFAHGAAKRIIAENDQIIEEEAGAAGIDPNLLRALMYVEVARGYPGDMIKKHVFEPQIASGKLNPARAMPGLPRKLVSPRESFYPMNIRPADWAELVDGADLAEDARMNIRAAARLVKGIQDRVVDPTPAKIGSLYNFMGAEHLNEHGERVQKVYDRKLWQQDGPGDKSGWFME